MARLSLLLITLVCFTSQIYARTLEGTVVSGADSTALVGASCRLLSNGAYVTGTTASQSGEFSITTDLKSTLTLEISMTGYSATNIIIDEGSKNIELGTIYLDEGVELGEVTVSANQVVHSQGRTIVYPSAADLRASSSAIGLFQKLPFPGVEANPINHTLAVDGGSPVILINGVPSTMDDMNALQPKDIEKIEYSRFTPARYADSGKTGLISITLKQRSDGGQIYAWGRSAVNTAFMDANIRASYHQGPSQFTLYYHPSWRNYQDVYDNVTESYIGNDFRVDLEEHDRAPFNYHFHNISLKYDLSPSAKTLFTATFTASPSFNKHSSIADVTDSQLGQYSNSNLSKSRTFSPSLDLFLRHDFNERNSLEVQVVGTLTSNDYRRNNHYTFADGTANSYIMNVDSRRRSLISEASYIHTFSERTTLSAGFQNTISRSTNTYLTSDYKPVLTENNNYIYARLGQNIGPVYLSLATGAKLFWINNDVNRRHFIRNLSSAQISWNINEQWSLQGSVRYTPAIPSLANLTDYRQQTTPYLVTNGNPDLKVAENLLYSLSADFTYRKLTVSLSTLFADMHNSAVSNVSYLGDGLFLSQTVNAKYRRVYQNDLSLRLSDIHGFGANLYLCFCHYSTAGSDWRHHLNSFDASFTLWWNHGPFTIAYWRKVPGKYLNGHYVGKEENGDALQLEWEPNKHFTVGASWMYMFDSKGTRYPSWNYSTVNPSYSERYIKNNANMIVLSLSYSADFGSIFRTSRRNLNNSDRGSSLLEM